MNLTVLPGELLPGDRLPTPDGLGPSVERVGDAVESSTFGSMIPVHLVGQEAPRMLPAATPITIHRLTDATEPLGTSS